MKRGYSPTISQVMNEFSTRKQKDERNPINKSINYYRYFCHYNNAVYMGGMSSYKKHGKGLLFHDDGSAVVTQYLHDTPFGHNIIFRENSITSVLFRNYDYQIAYKAGKCIIKIPFNITNQAHGYGILIDYEISKIFKLIFKKGVLIEKILILNREINDQVFKNNMITKIIGVKHQQAFQLTFQKPDNMHIKYDRNKLTIGYFDDKGQLHGLAFKMYAENAEVSGYKGLYLKSIERGYYRHQKLETFGQKYFSNGNKYIGQFEKGQFHGHGILVCPQQMKWVYGKFENGILSQVIDSNNKNYTENDFQIWAQSLWNIHKRYRERWIDLDIQLPSQLHLYTLLKQAIRREVTEIDPDIELEMRQDFQRLSRIQHQFQEGYSGSLNKSFVEDELDRHYDLKSKKNNRHFQSSPINKSKYFGEESPKKMRDNYRVQLSKTNKSYQAQKYFRMQDPFKNDPIKIENEQFESQPQIDYRKRKLNKQIKQNGYIDPRSFRSYNSNYDNIQYPHRQHYDPVSRLYRQKQLSQISRLRRKCLELQEQMYMRDLGLSKSPTHRNYYSTPPKFDLYPERFNGRITPKRHFNYQEPRQLYPSKYPYVQKGQYPSNYDDMSTNKKSPEKMSPRNSQSTTANRNFVANNHKLW